MARDSTHVFNFMDSFVLTTTLTLVPGHHNFLTISSDDNNAAQRTFELTAGMYKGHQLFVEWAGATGKGRILDGVGTLPGSVTCRLNGDWSPTQWDVLQLVWNGSEWLEVGRSVN